MEATFYIRKFVSHEIHPLESYRGTRPFQLLEKCCRGEKLTRQDKDAIFSLTTEHHGVHLLMGYRYNFRPFMRRFLVHYKDYPWEEVYAPDKMSIRNFDYHPRILEIVEIPKK